jgi:DNA-binding response OmpR family regulator
MMAGETVLIVDDDRSFTNALSEYLQSHGLSTYPTITGTAAIAISQRVKPDLAIVDVQLPDMSGTQVTRQIREQHSNTPIIMISADDSQENMQRCQQVQADRFMAKPVDPQALLEAVRNALDTRDSSN